MSPAVGRADMPVAKETELEPLTMGRQQEEEEGTGDDAAGCPDRKGSDAANKTEASKADASPTFLGIPMKFISLVSLTLQTTLQVFVIKWAHAGNKETGTKFLASTVVLMTELTKVVVSFLLASREYNGLKPAYDVIYASLTEDYMETAHVCVPALLYTVQNNLMFYSLTKLSAAVQQLTYQLKILTTALLSVIILGKVLKGVQWLALIVLLLGVCLVQYPRNAEAGSVAASFTGDAMLGFLAVLIACFTSGGASVYIEKLMKKKGSSIWVRNVQLGLVSSIMAVMVAITSDGSKIIEAGFFQGYSERVAATVLNNALGGLLCAAVLKYADNILRNFSTGSSILLTCWISSAALHEVQIDDYFMVGTILTLFSIFLYNVDVSFRLRGRLPKELS